MGGGWPRRTSRVSLLRQYLDRIGQLFFGVPPKQTSSYGGLLGEARAGHGGRGLPAPPTPLTAGGRPGRRRVFSAVPGAEGSHRLGDLHLVPRPSPHPTPRPALPRRLRARASPCARPSAGTSEPGSAGGREGGHGVGSGLTGACFQATSSAASWAPRSRRARTARTTAAPSSSTDADARRGALPGGGSRGPWRRWPWACPGCGHGPHGAASD